jgi:hypothetical protein
VVSRASLVTYLRIWRELSVAFSSNAPEVLPTHLANKLSGELKQKMLGFHTHVTLSKTDGESRDYWNPAY